MQAWGGMGPRQVLQCVAPLIVLLLFYSDGEFLDSTLVFFGIFCYFELMTNRVPGPINRQIDIVSSQNLNSQTKDLSLFTAAEGGSWCVASPEASQTALQQGLDYACGQGGADCSAIQAGGSCFQPNTHRDHASYAYNSYYQKAPAGSSCDFGASAILTSKDPSNGSCKYPSMR
jgi:hypothetical protein